MENLIFSLNATLPLFFTMALGTPFRNSGPDDRRFYQKGQQVCVYRSASSSAL